MHYPMSPSGKIFVCTVKNMFSVFTSLTSKYGQKKLTVNH